MDKALEYIRRQKELYGKNVGGNPVISHAKLLDILHTIEAKLGEVE